MPMILRFIGTLILGALGALVFMVVLLPYLLTNPYFENYQFVKDFKEGKIIVNPKEEIYIQENTALQDAVARVQKSVVTFQSAAGIRQGLLVTSDGLIVSLANGMALNGTVNVVIEGAPISAKVMKVDSQRNLALLKIEKQNLPTVGFASLAQLKLGQRVFLTSALTLLQDEWVANEGIIRQITVTSIKTNIAESRIVSGSPLFIIGGELAGLSFIDVEGKVSAVPIDIIKEFLGL
ncbi:MAG: hypothetical protein Q7S10_01045 [bacterium]|nr:hypothetical protein [bacterium]